MTATFVLVHGAWHGGWCWEQVADGLRASGYRAAAPTLAGLGDRAGEAHAGIGLGAHVDEVARLVAQFREVVVVGHSYGGMGLDHLAGSLEPGKQADLIVVDMFALNLWPVATPVQQVAYFATGDNVRPVFVNGRHVVDDGTLTTIDEHALLEEAGEQLQRLQTIPALAYPNSPTPHPDSTKPVGIAHPAA